MRTQKFFLFAGLALMFIITSCKIENRRYMPGYYIDWQIAKQNTDKQNPAVNENGEKIQPNKFTEVVQFEKIKTDTTKTISNTNLLASIDKLVITKTSSRISPVKKENLPFYYYINNERYNIYEPKSQYCDTMLLWTGEKVPCKIVEVGLQYKIKYRSCDDLEGPIKSIDKPLVKIIKYSDGNQEIISTTPPDKTEVGKHKLLIGIFGFLLGIGGIFYYGIILGLAAIVAGSIGLGIILKHPDKFSGAGLAIIGILLGVFDIVMILTAFAII